MLFGMNTVGGPWNIVLDGGPGPSAEKGGGGDENFGNCGHTTYLMNG